MEGVLSSKKERDSMMLYQLLCQSSEGIALMVSMGAILVFGLGLTFFQMGEECGLCGYVRKMFKRIIKKIIK
ncbi:hypothetical protein D4R99_00640 [bacterium]|nr:MAG: hypothetical protein D4R99_00640 [bacterium]